ncbi:hypothetical protein D0T25_25655 [Duganella sp. BJB488]|uniref:DUF7931 domain-containing protein n=1 Tax=unclassified Duganella TaxID=2636909 RepID=UPI000E350B9C|nr:MULTISPECIES: hypothetical protein [unclassified Duganella]RFP11734.1 hypothetical protein D0T26_25625 [Duganella sp. BJB489]RFP15552.1 hypothetical protein D0T25_25655 [Duganella sp. BJB488]RFP30500.1 hypothetical protein D0T24_26355 [Duganella sp. BJB480]
MDRQSFPFTTRAEFLEHLASCFTRAERTLTLFDPDFAIWELGSSATDALLRRFLHNGGQLQLAGHDGHHIERDAPRFLRLIKDYSHLVEVRRTSQQLRQLTDSFCIADERHIVRRFHADHFRGEAVFDGPEDTQTSGDRFITIWLESTPSLFANSTGL